MGKSAAPTESLEARILRRIKRQRRAVFLREDFGDLGGYDQVGRALRVLVSRGQLMRMGYGVYNKTEPSTFGDRMVPAKTIDRLAEEALNRLGVTVVPTRMERDYNAGRSTQVPTGRVVGIKGRIRRKLRYNTVDLSYERV